MSKIKSFDDACKALGIQYTPQKGLTKDEIAYQKLKIVAKALNEGWEPDWSNRDQYKYYPWQRFVAGSGFVPDGCGCDRSHTFVSSRLCYKSRELALYAGEQFADLYNDFFSL